MICDDFQRFLDAASVKKEHNSDSLVTLLSENENTFPWKLILTENFLKIKS